MTKKDLERKTDAAVMETRVALQAVYDELNHGQQKKLLKNEEIADLFARYGVVTE